jgi:hypothetical protein
MRSQHGTSARRLRNLFEEPLHEAEHIDLSSFVPKHDDPEPDNTPDNTFYTVPPTSPEFSRSDFKMRLVRTLGELLADKLSLL